MKELFVTRTFNSKSQELIDLVNMILDEYRSQGFRLSLRQLYYQLVARDYIPNTQRSYSNLGNLVSKARQAGQIDWEMIEDRGRETVSNSHWENPAEIILSASRQFKIDKWQDQEWHIEVMVEKDALSGVLVPVCRELDVSITANKGYSSSSTMYEVGTRLKEQNRESGKSICILYLGDHDPSGIDMTRDVTDRLVMYSRIDEIEIIRLALNWDQIELWRPPENPAKETDSRYAAYALEFGESSWELDAIEPNTLASLVRNQILALRDQALWDEALAREKLMKDDLEKFARNYRFGDQK